MVRSLCVVDKIQARGNSTGRLGGGRNPLPLGNKERLNIVGLGREKGGR